MGFVRCPGCGSQNRDSDTKCYSCEGELTPGQEGPPSGALDESQVGQPVMSASEKRMTLDDKRKSTLVHGLRAGAAGGAFLGIFWGLYYAFWGGLFGSIVGEWSGMAIGGGLMFIIGFTQQVILGLVIGAVAGALNELCYQYDSMRLGSYVGAAWGLLALLSGNGSFLGVLFSGFWGGVMGWIVSFVEKAWFRKMYAEM